MTTIETIRTRLGKKLVVLAVVAGALGVAVPVAGAQSSGDAFYWSAVLAKHRLLNQDISFDDGTYEDVIAAECRGKGRYILNNTGTLRLFRQHTCAVVTASGNAYLLNVKVLNRFDFRFRVLQNL